ncbi:halocyanin domain-containing protein [Halorubrum trueperi]|uniref:Halocyanin domain-containing protein n=1 Tax=Halorubrum trueperi TaxID=2004704 RepID=A0ABD5UK36_9EURY
MTERTRRSLLAAAGSVAAVPLAGCADAILPGGGDDEDNGSDEEPVDRTGEETVDVAVGGDGGLSFVPANVVVDAGTTVVWEWTGVGGTHDVVARDGTFESDLSGTEGYTFERAFEEPGVYEYVCTPHQTRGMVGSVEVVE